MSLNLPSSARVERFWFLLAIGILIFHITTAGNAAASDNVVVQWNVAALQGVRDSRIGPPMVARALAIVHTCMFDAWSAYDERAVGTQFGDELRRPKRERTLANKNEAISFAAYRALVDLFALDKASVFDPLMASLGYDPNNLTVNTDIPAGIGNVACAAVLAFRHGDGSNQLGDLHPGAYSDWTGYVSVNSASTVPVDPASVLDPNHWQRLSYDDGATAPTPRIVTQSFVGAQWYRVVPFAMTSADQFRPFLAQFGPALYGSETYLQQSKHLIIISANLTDEQKMIAEYWANGPRTELPPGHWDLFGEFVSRRDHHTVDDDAKMFFALTNAIFDAGIAAWDAKRAFDSVRPITSIPYLFHGQQIKAWRPFQGTQTFDGSLWIPFQLTTFPTPPCRDSQALHPQRQIRRFCDLFRRKFQHRAGFYTQTRSNPFLGHFHRRCEPGWNISPVWRNPFRACRYCGKSHRASSRGSGMEESTQPY